MDANSVGIDADGGDKGGQDERKGEQNEHCASDHDSGSSFHSADRAFYCVHHMDASSGAFSWRYPAGNHP